MEIKLLSIKNSFEDTGEFFFISTYVTLCLLFTYLDFFSVFPFSLLSSYLSHNRTFEIVANWQTNCATPCPPQPLISSTPITRDRFNWYSPSTAIYEFFLRFEKRDFDVFSVVRGKWLGVKWGDYHRQTWQNAKSFPTRLEQNCLIIRDCCLTSVLKSHIKLWLNGLLAILINWTTVLYPQPLPSNIWNQLCPFFFLFYYYFL